MFDFVLVNRRGIGISGLMFALVIAVALSVGLAFAAPPQSKPQEKDSGLLAGPTVEDEAQQLSEQRRKNQDAGENARRQGEVPFQQWMEIVRQLDLNSQQQIKIRAIAE